MFDLLLSTGGLLFFALPMLWIALSIRRTSRYPAIFRQIRIGYEGRLFTIIKFRTLSESGRLLSLFSQYLRNTAMDELPQLFNILRGQMSFVGPRPLIPEELEELRTMKHGTRRFEVRPGLTGLAQLYATKVPPLAERLRWDVRYADGSSLFLDLGILWKSLCVTFRGAWERQGSQTSPKNLKWPSD